MSKQDLKNRQYASYILQHLHYFYLTGQMCDIALVSGIDGRSLRTHRLVLAACIPYFMTIFTGTMTERGYYEITLDKILSSDIKKIVDYCYTGRIELCDLSVQDVFVAACVMQLPIVVSLCTEYLVDRVNKRNCWSLWAFTHIHAHERLCQDLLKRSKAYIIANCGELHRYGPWSMLSFDQLSELLTRDDLYVEAEDNVFFVMVRWVASDPHSRVQYIPQFFHMLRIPYLEAEYTKDRVKYYSKIFNCEKLLNEMIEKRKRRKPKQLIVVSNNTENVQLYEPTLNQWITWNKKHPDISIVDAIAAMDDELFIVSSCSFPTHQVYVFTFNMSKHEWTKSTPMNSFRINYGVAVVGRYLYVVGGQGANHIPVNIVERWHIRENSWSYVASMPTSRNDAKIAVMDNCLYVFGGFVRHTSLCDSLECYNPITNTWSTKASTKYKVASETTLCVRNDVLYAFGTRNLDSTYFERYDKDQNQWTVIYEDKKNKFATLSCVLYEDKFLLMDVTQSCFTYDPVDNKLELQPSLIYSSRKLNSVIVPNTITHLFKHC